MRYWRIVAVIILISILSLIYIIVGKYSLPPKVLNNSSDKLIWSNETPQVLFYANNTGNLDRAITWDYNYNGKHWRYFSMKDATCHEVTCECAKNTETPCAVYCMICDAVNESGGVK